MDIYLHSNYDLIALVYRANLQYHCMIFIGILVLLTGIIFQLPIKPIFSSSNEDGQPLLRDPKLNVHAIVDQGLSSPTSMTFMNENNILVLEKNSGDVRLVTDGVLKAEPVLHLEVDNTTLTCCRGLLGIETLPRIGGISYAIGIVLFYLTCITVLCYATKWIVLGSSTIDGINFKNHRA